MAGTHEGGKKAAETAKERHGDEFHKEIGSKGGQARGHEQNETHRGESSRRENDSSHREGGRSRKEDDE